MAVEDALIRQAQPYMLAAKAKSLIQNEIRKGCEPFIYPEPLALEPIYEPFGSAEDLNNDDNKVLYNIEPYPDIMYWKRLQIWVSPHQNFDWNKSELFLKQLQSISHRIGFEIAGNEEKSYLSFLCHHDDEPLLKGAFRGEFEFCELSSVDFLWKCCSEKGLNIVFNDYFPAPPYSHLLTCPDEIKTSPFRAIVSCLSEIEAPSFGIFQVLFQPVSPFHNWHRNVQAMRDFEYQIKLISNMNALQKYQQQIPSGDLHQMSSEICLKAHNDKPFFAVALRVGVIGNDEISKNHLITLSSVVNLYQHGGRPLNYINETDYVSQLNLKQIKEMFLLGTNYRPGFILNSQELCGLVHIPSFNKNEPRKFPMDTLISLPVEQSLLSTGTTIGTCPYAGITIPVCIPDKIRGRHTHLIGRSGMGKSCLQEHMILDDAKRGHGVAVLDPHGDLVDKLLDLFPAELVDRVIYLNPGDPNWIPLWNPLELLPGQEYSRVADDLVGAIKNVVTGWGDRLEHLLRNSFYALLQIQNTTLLDVYNLLIKKSDESKRLKSEILKIIDNVSAERFWKEDFDRYKDDDLAPPKHKLSKMLISGTVSWMLSQPVNAFNFRQIMDEGKIILINLSTIGSEVREILGCFILSLLHLTALGRSNVHISQRKQFHIYCDEAHRFITNAMEDLISETRKFGVSLTLANQYLSQFSQKKTDAISNVGSTIIFNVDTKDARYLLKDLGGKVKIEDMISLGVGEAIARVGLEVVRINTPMPLESSSRSVRSEIIQKSRERYYKPVHEIRKMINNRSGRWDQTFTPLTPADNDFKPEQFEYDEF